MKKYLIVVIALCGFAFAQVRSDIAIQNTSGNWLKAIPGARIYVCNSSATNTQCLQGVAGGQTITVYTDSNLSVTTTQPIVADSQGNYTVFAAAGIYLECVISATSLCRKIVIPSSGGTPGGSNQQVQFNNSGAFGGDPNLLWNSATKTLTINSGTIQSIPGGNNAGGIYLASSADFSGLLPPGNPGNLGLWLWMKPNADKDQYALMQGGTTVEARTYWGFMSKDGNYRWLIGKNAGAPEGAGDFGNFIIYDATSGAHRAFMRSKFDGTGGSTWINSNGNFPVIINGNTGLDNGEGTSLQVYCCGGATPTLTMSQDPTTGIWSFFQNTFFTDNGVAGTGPITVQKLATSDTTAQQTWEVSNGTSQKGSLYWFTTGSLMAFGPDTASDFQLNTNATGRFRIHNATGSMWIGSPYCHDWTSAANMATVDTSFCRNAAGVMTIGKTDSTSDTSGTLAISRLQTGSLTPTCTFTSGGGTSPSCSFRTGSTDVAGTIIATTGTGSPGGTGTITLTFSAGTTFAPHSASCIYMPNNGGAGAWNGLATTIDTTPGTASDLFTWTNGTTPTTLSTSTAYWINYHCWAI